jgi:hypothetical protein
MPLCGRSTVRVIAHASDSKKLSVARAPQHEVRTGVFIISEGENAALSAHRCGARSVF